jgi:hypothetical protein
VPLAPSSGSGLHRLPTPGPTALPPLPNGTMSMPAAAGRLSLYADDEGARRSQRVRRLVFVVGIALVAGLVAMTQMGKGQPGPPPTQTPTQQK